MTWVEAIQHNGRAFVSWHVKWGGHIYLGIFYLLWLTGLWIIASIMFDVIPKPDLWELIHNFPELAFFAFGVMFWSVGSIGKDLAKESIENR